MTALERSVTSPSGLEARCFYRNSFKSTKPRAIS